MHQKYMSERNEIGEGMFIDFGYLYLLCEYVVRTITVYILGKGI